MNGTVLNELLNQPQAAGIQLDVQRPLTKAIVITKETKRTSRLPLLRSVRAALEGGVASVSLCRPADVARELFTYEGRGTLFTLTDYCRVEPLGLDDFYEAEQLIQRGEREGYLKPRSRQETGQLLLHGHGARLGVVGGELAGLCALLPYPRENAGEIVGLYTITRFQGEGIGGRLVATMIEQARAGGLDYVFACTSQAGARRLFERCGFRRVAAEQVAAEKWQQYDPARKNSICVYRTDLTVAKVDDDNH
jgi:amino-acid N-acetyltransferase